MKRVIAAAIKNGYMEAIGRGPATTYKLTPQVLITMPLNLELNLRIFRKNVFEKLV